MYSVKPGRGPSLMGGIGALIGIVFVFGWIALAQVINAPPLFTAFGFLMLVLLICQAIYQFYNATQRHRLSSLDVVQDQEEFDPIARAMGYDQKSSQNPPPPPASSPDAAKYCPYCGSPLQADFEYCPQCGKDI